MRFSLKVIDWLRTGSESPKNSKNYMPEEKIEEKNIGMGLALVLNSENPFQNVTILGRRYSPKQGIFYNRVHLAGLESIEEYSSKESNLRCLPTVDYLHGRLDEVFSYLISGEKRPASLDEISEIKKRIDFFSGKDSVDSKKFEDFRRRMFLFEDFLPSLNGNLSLLSEILPQSIKDKYRVK